MGVPLEELLADFGLETSAERQNALNEMFSQLGPYEQRLFVRLGETIHAVQREDEEQAGTSPVPISKRRRLREEIPEPLKGAAFSEPEIVEEAGRDEMEDSGTA
jgi:hypothetical protein